MSQDERQRWDDRYRRGAKIGDPGTLLPSLHDLLPTAGRALDLAGGSGAQALWLASRGLDTTLLDISSAALALATVEAEVRGVTLRTVQMDLDIESPPPGPWDVILCRHYLNRDLVPVLIDALAEQGLLIMAQQTVCNLERHVHPSRRFLLNRGEMLELVRAFRPSNPPEFALDVLSYGEDWSDGGCHEARLVARRVAHRDGAGPRI